MKQLHDTGYHELITDPKKESFYNLTPDNPLHGTQLFYYEFPTYYTWSNNKWKRKAKGYIDLKRTIRLYDAHPTSERYFIRTILMNKPGNPHYSIILVIHIVLLLRYLQL